MPIPPLQHTSHDDEHDEHQARGMVFVILKWVVIAGVMGGVVFLFVFTDKEMLTERGAGISALVNQFDHWITQAAETFIILFD